MTTAAHTRRASSAAAIALPRLIVDAGPSAVARFLEFFAGRILVRLLSGVEMATEKGTPVAT